MSDTYLNPLRYELLSKYHTVFNIHRDLRSLNKFLARFSVGIFEFFISFRDRALG